MEIFTFDFEIEFQTESPYNWLNLLTGSKSCEITNGCDVIKGRKTCTEQEFNRWQDLVNSCQFVKITNVKGRHVDT